MSKRKDSGRRGLLKRFADATIRAAMASDPAVMQASGWDYDRNGNLVQGNPNAPGASALRNSLAVMSSIPNAVMGAGLAAPVIANEAALVGGPGLGQVAANAALETGTGLLGFEAVDRMPYLWNGSRVSEQASDLAESGVRAIMPDGRAEEIVAGGARLAAPLLVGLPEGVVGSMAGRAGAGVMGRIDAAVERKLADLAAKKDWKAFKQFAKENKLGVSKDPATGEPILLSWAGPVYVKNGKLEPIEGKNVAGSAAIGDGQSIDTFTPGVWENWMKGHGYSGFKTPAEAFPHAWGTPEDDMLYMDYVAGNNSLHEYWNKVSDLDKKFAANPKLKYSNIDKANYPHILESSIDKYIDEAIANGTSPGDLADMLQGLDKKVANLTAPATPVNSAPQVHTGPALIDMPSVEAPSQIVTPQSHLNTVTDGKIMKTLPNISVKTPGREQVDQILRGVKEGALPPLETQVFDYFGRPITIPDWWAAAMRTDAAKAAYPEGADYLWRGFNSKAANNSAGRPDKWMEIPTGYASLFGGDHNLASDYTAHFNTRAPSIDYSTNGGIPNLMLFTVPKGKIYDVGNIGGQRWSELYRPTPQNNALKTKYYDEVALRNNGSKGMSDNDYVDLLREYNKMRADNPFVLNGRVMRTTDDIADFLSNPVENTPGFDASGVVLRNIHDGMIGDEVIWNIGRGGSPKLVHPGNSFEFDLANRHWLNKNGGSIHIDPSKRGTFKAQASRMGMSVKQAAAHILAHPENYSPAMRKKANFARNFAADGGPIWNESTPDTQDWVTRVKVGKRTYNYEDRTDLYDKDRYYDVVQARYNGLVGAMKRAGMESADIDRLAPFTTVQNVLEGGWRVNKPERPQGGGLNNFGGMRGGEHGFQNFETPDEYYDAYLANLDDKWGDERLGEGNGWRNAQSLDDFARIIQNRDLNLTTKPLFDEYNKKHPDNPAYIYTPLWENNGTDLMSSQKFGGITDRVNAYIELLKRRNYNRAGGLLDRLKAVYGDNPDEIKAAILRAKNVKKQ